MLEHSFTWPHSLKFFDGAGCVDGDHVVVIWRDVDDATLVLAWLNLFWCSSSSDMCVPSDDVHDADDDDCGDRHSPAEEIDIQNIK